MISARRVLQSIRRWSYLGAMPFVAALAVAACGGKVVVDGEGSGGAGGGATTQSSAAVSPSTGSSPTGICNAAAAHLVSCDPSVDPIPEIPPCEGMIRCQFTCLLNTSCEGILGTDTNATLQLTDCLIACG
jgi:hypothetical protein